MGQTYYDVLGVAENAGDSEIEVAFKSKAREVHPDRVRSNSPYLQKIAADAFKELSEARSVLLDHHKREKYDSALACMRGSSSSTTAPPPSPPRSASAGVAHSPSAQAAAPSPPTPHPANKSPFWKLTNTKFGTVTLLIGISGCAVFLGALAESEMALLGLALALMSLALLWWRHGMRSETDPEVLGGSVFLFLLSIMCFSGWHGSLPNIPKFASVSTDGMSPHTSRSSDGLQTNPTQSVSEQKARIIPTPAQKLDISSLSAEERQSIEAVCSSATYFQGPAAYDQCVDSHLTRLASGPRRPDLSGLTFEERQSIEAACSSAKDLQGPAEYNGCLVNQLETLKAYRH